MAGHWVYSPSTELAQMQSEAFETQVTLASGQTVGIALLASGALAVTGNPELALQALLTITGGSSAVLVTARVKGVLERWIIRIRDSKAQWVED